MERKELLKLENQICFPLYVTSKEIIRQYKPFLDELNLTYTQYITLLALWEKDNVLVKELGERLYLDSGTLTPLLINLEKKNYIKRIKDKNDGRELHIVLTDEGRALEDRALEIPFKVGRCINIDAEDAIKLHEILGKLTRGFVHE